MKRFITSAFFAMSLLCSSALVFSSATTNSTTIIKKVVKKTTLSNEKVTELKNEIKTLVKNGSIENILLSPTQLITKLNKLVDKGTVKTIDDAEEAAQKLDLYTKNSYVISTLKSIFSVPSKFNNIFNKWPSTVIRRGIYGTGLLLTTPVTACEFLIRLGLRNVLPQTGDGFDWLLSAGARTLVFGGFVLLGLAGCYMAQDTIRHAIGYSAHKFIIPPLDFIGKTSHTISNSSHNWSKWVHSATAYGSTVTR